MLVLCLYMDIPYSKKAFLSAMHDARRRTMHICDDSDGVEGRRPATSGNDGRLRTMTDGTQPSTTNDDADESGDDDDDDDDQGRGDDDDDDDDDDGNER